MRCFCTKTKTYHCKVVLLDDQELLQEILNTSTGQDVLDTVFRHLNLIETSYFGLRYVDCTNQTHWLDTTKKIAKQLKGKDSFTLYFGVKFYAADPCKLVEEITRYQFFLQVKQDILQGRLAVSFDVLAELGAYAVQSELGDYDARRHAAGYVSEFRFVSNQSVELENKIAQMHNDLQGQLPAVAELNYLDKVKWLEMYGVDLHPVIGEDNVEYFLGLTPTGVIVLRNKSKVASYFWSRIKKIYFKGKYFMLRVSDKNNEENTYGFETPSRAACKHLYKCCKEHHSFFQLVHVSTNAPDVVSTRFSSNRIDKLSGRSSQLGMRNPPSFVRTPSRRYQKRIVEGASEESKLEEKLPISENNSAADDPKNIYVTPTPNSFYPTRSDSPRSTRSTPWNVWSSSGPPRPTHSSHSPRSVRSAGPQLRLSHARRSSSVESQSSTDSRPCRRHKHRSKRGSDNESDLSRCSSHGHGSRRRRHRHRSRRSSGSEQESHVHHSSRSRYQLIDSGGQWKEVQRKKAEGSSIHEATVVRPGSGYVNTGIETESEHSNCHHHRRKHRKHRSRSRSPSEGGKPYLPDELKQHLEFQLVDTEGMSEDQLREIPYTVVKTNAAKAVRVRLSSTGKPKMHSIRRTKNDGVKPSQTGYSEDSPPPPYSESPVLSDLSNKITGTITTAAAATTGDSNKHGTRLPSHLMRNNKNSSPRSPSSALYSASSAVVGQQNYSSQSNLNSKDIEEKTAWLSENSKFSNLGFVVGLPPQPHARRPHNSNSHPDLSLNTCRSQNQNGWPSPEIRGTVGMPRSSVSEHLESPSSISLYSSHENNRRAPSLNSIDYNNLNQNMLEPRANGISNASFRSSSKAGPQSATTPPSQYPNRSTTVDSEKLKKPNTLAESGVLRSHAITPNGMVAWPNERHVGWQQSRNEKSMNLNQSRNTNGSGWSASDYNQWNCIGLPSPSSVAQNWLQPAASYRTSERGGMYSSQPQMQRINEEASQEAYHDYVNLMNNNSISESPKSPNNNQFSDQNLNGMNGICGISETSSNEMEINGMNLNFTNIKTNSTSPTEDTKNNNDSRPIQQFYIKQFFQEMSTEL